MGACCVKIDMSRIFLPIIKVPSKHIVRLTKFHKLYIINYSYITEFYRLLIKYISFYVNSIHIHIVCGQMRYVGNDVIGTINR